MPGMSSGVAPGNPVIVAAFRSALAHQALVVLAILVLLAIAWGLLRSVELRRAAATAGAIGGIGGPAHTSGRGGSKGRAADPEPIARRLLRIGFGLLWIFDGILQGQTSMPLGMTSKVIGPAAAASPTWVRHLAGFAVTIWSYHPIAVAAAVVWIQLGIGLFLLVAPRGRWSRAAGAVSLGWGLAVWVFGEAFGGLFAPGASWMFGAPGAAVLYCIAGTLILLDEASWEEGRLGRATLRILGAIFLLMAVLQAWPGRGFWHGESSPSGKPGALATMVRTMAATPQPRYLASWMSSFASFAGAHGFAVNLFVVLALVVLGLAFLSDRPTVVLWAVAGSVPVCLVDWVLVQDWGFFGGTGTDPNSMVPMLMLIVAGYIALTRTRAESEFLSPELELPASLEPDLGWRSGSESIEPSLTWTDRLRDRPVYVFRALCALGAVGVLVLGAAPMAAASLNGRADPIIYQAIDGLPERVDTVAPSFVLSNQSGTLTSLSSLRGKVVVLSFLDPVGTQASPALGEVLQQTSSLLSAVSRRVELVAVVTNPLYRSMVAMRTFDRIEGLDRTANWLYLTGPASRLSQVWKAYGISVHLGPPGSRVATSYLVFVIDAAGTERYRLDASPGAASRATRASFAGVLAAVVNRVVTVR